VGIFRFFNFKIQNPSGSFLISKPPDRWPPVIHMWYVWFHLVFSFISLLYIYIYSSGLAPFCFWILFWFFCLLFFFGLVFGTFISNFCGVLNANTEIGVVEAYSELIPFMETDVFSRVVSICTTRAIYSFAFAVWSSLVYTRSLRYRAAPPKPIGRITILQIQEETELREGNQIYLLWVSVITLAAGFSYVPGAW
jgi:hypothetical protein